MSFDATSDEANSHTITLILEVLGDTHVETDSEDFVVRHLRQTSGAPETDTVGYSGQGWGLIGPSTISQRTRLPPLLICLMTVSLGTLVTSLRALISGHLVEVAESQLVWERGDCDVHAPWRNARRYHVPTTLLISSCDCQFDCRSCKSTCRS